MGSETRIRRSAALKLAAFAAVLAVVFAAASLAGATIGPDRSEEQAAAGMDEREEGHARTTARGTAAAHGEAAPVRGLAVSADGLTLALEASDFEPGRPGELRFAILDARGGRVRDFDLEHERRMHVIVVRRDGSGFQHLHPQLGRDGVWSVPVALERAGVHRVFADFSHRGEAQTLAADLVVDGQADYRRLPEPAGSAEAGDGHEVRIDAHAARAGREAELRFRVTQDGEAIRPEPYLGARGHLVALREGDLAFLHVHPDEDELAFTAEFPSPGRYRLYLQFEHDGAVHTAEFTRAVRQ